MFKYIPLVTLLSLPMTSQAFDASKWGNPYFKNSMTEEKAEPIVVKPYRSAFGTQTGYNVERRGQVDMECRYNTRGELECE